MIKLILATVLACNLAALTPAERKEHAAVTQKLLVAVIQRTETPDGFAFRLDRARVALAEVKMWIARESRCCPFINFALDEPAFTLRLGGGDGVKDFIASEFRLRRPEEAR